MTIAGKNILLTGGTGLIGQALVSEMAGAHAIWSLSRKGPSHPGVQWVNQDLQAREFGPNLPDNIDVVVHLAQSAVYRDFPEKAEEIFQVNVHSTLTLLDWARRTGVHRFVYASSGGVYGTGPVPFKEADPIDPEQIGFYQSSKALAESLVRQYRGYFECVIVRPFFVYGERQRPGMLIPRMIQRVDEGQPIQLQGHSGIRINPMAVEDAAQALRILIDLEGHDLVNLGGPEVLSLRQICEAIGDFLGRPPVFEVQPKEPQHLIGDIGYLSERLGAPPIRFADKVNRMCERFAGPSTQGS